MRNRPVFNEENGLTLVEILATLVIIGIVFIGVMSIFPQMTLFNERTDVKLDAMNIAREEMALFKSLDAEKLQNEDLVTFAKRLAENFEAVNPNADMVNVRGGTGGIAVLTYGLKSGEFVEAIISPPDEDEQFDDYQLHKVHLMVSEREGSHNMSETYGYLKVREVFRL
ncbi:type IV pilus modification PilV family protein [Bhargavaea cecembensis]|uniref:type IV pilus modification PilV family protein n=1 Tax=Bhargavaea cecembensis TaxID=394098 RepID=UPI00058F27F1|nr:type II secretion system protein [Bhargavaea cecembensis]